MKTKYQRTRCTVKLHQSDYHKDEFYLNIETYPVPSKLLIISKYHCSLIASPLPPSPSPAHLQYAPLPYLFVYR
jgi:hypothetical protein